MRPLCILRNFVRLGCSISCTPSLPASARAGALAITPARAAAAFLHFGLTPIMGLRIMFHDLAFEDPDLDPDLTIGGDRLDQRIVDIGTKRVQRHTAFPIPFGPRDLGAAKTSGAVDPDALRAHAHRILHRPLHRAAEADPTLELLGDVLGHQMRIDLRPPDLDDVEMQLGFRELGHLLAQILDIRALATDDHPRPRRVDRHPALAVRALDHDAADAGLLGLLADEVADPDVLMQQVTKILRIGVPAAVPGPVDLQAQRDRIDFLCHQTCSSTWRTLIVSWLNGFRMRPNPPRARGRPRFSTTFLPTSSSATLRSSTSRP